MSTRTFPPQVFARLAPDQYMQRHLEAGVRPTGRGLYEFREIEVKTGDKALSALGSSVVRCGDCTVICGILPGLTDFEGEGGVFPNVKTYRMGRTAVPTLEEQCLSEKLAAQIRAAAIPRENFVISVDDQITETRKELVLRADIQVLSRSGPSLDACWAALVAALRDTKIPKFRLDERWGTVVAEENPSRALELPSTLATVSYSVGKLQGTLLADIDGATEESSVGDVIEVFECADESLSGVYLRAGNEGFTMEELRRVLGKGRNSDK